MDKEKKSNIQAASLVDLKAELYRKQEEFKQQKLKDKGLSYVRPKPSEKKSDIWCKKNAGVLERAQRDLERKAEEENVFENSKKKLEEKARMYDRITQGSEIPEEDGSKIYLVDFQKKVIDQMVDDREKDRERRKKEEEDELRNQEEEILAKTDAFPPPASKDEEWVDYVDSFGRTRTCMRKDLKDLTKQDKKLTAVSMPTLLSEDMRRELQRQKWEEEAQANLNGPVHYSNVQFDEIRNHGTGYFQFSKAEETRKKEMETLGDLRQQTLDERSRRERLKEKRKAVLDARLAKVKQRKQQREGGVLISTEKDEDVPLAENVSEKVTKKLTVEEPPLLTRDVNINKDKPQREWDKGKEGLFPYESKSTEEKYFDERREERQSQFAPPSFYYSDMKKSTTTKSNQQRSERNWELGFTRSDVKQTHTKDMYGLSAENNRSAPVARLNVTHCDQEPKSNQWLQQKSDARDIDQFLERERKAATEGQKSDDVPTDNLNVRDIPLPSNICATAAKNVSTNIKNQAWNPDRSQGTGKDLSAEHKNISGMFPHNPMANFDVYGQPNINIAPPSVFSMVSPVTYQETAGSLSRMDGSYPVSSLQDTGYTYIQPTTGTTSLPTTQHTGYSTYTQHTTSAVPTTQHTDYPYTQHTSSAVSVPTTQHTDYPYTQHTSSAVSVPTTQHTDYPYTQHTRSAVSVPTTQHTDYPYTQHTRSAVSVPTTQHTDYPYTQHTSSAASVPTTQHTDYPYTQHTSSAASVPTTQHTDYPYTQHTSSAASVPTTENTTESTPVPIPKSSIVDTRLIRNESAIHSYDSEPVDEVKEQQKASDNNQQSNCETIVPNLTSNQTVFASAPVRYGQ